MPSPISPEEGAAERELQYHTNSICRTGCWDKYPSRLTVSPPNHLWSCTFPPYYPPVYCSDECDPVRPPDPLPQNPFGKTGLGGRGCLPEYGANATTHLIITRRRTRFGDLQVCTIPDPRTDWRSYRHRRLPPGVPSKWNKSWPGYGQVVHIGYLDDECNTDHAWFSTVATHIHVASRPGTTTCPQVRALLTRIGRIRWNNVPRRGNIPKLRNAGLVTAAVEMFNREHESLLDSLWALQATFGTLVICALGIAMEHPGHVILLVPGFVCLLVLIRHAKVQLRKLE